MVALLIVCGDIELNPGPGSDRWVLVLYSSIRGLHENLDELAAVGSDYDVLVCAEPKASDRRIRIRGFVAPNRGCGTPHLVSRAWLFMLGRILLLPAEQVGVFLL